MIHFYDKVCSWLKRCFRVLHKFCLSNFLLFLLLMFKLTSGDISWKSNDRYWSKNYAKYCFDYERTLVISFVDKMEVGNQIKPNKVWNPYFTIYSHTGQWSRQLSIVQIDRPNSLRFLTIPERIITLVHFKFLVVWFVVVFFKASKAQRAEEAAQFHCLNFQMLN